jgi:hypothetical protein
MLNARSSVLPLSSVSFVVHLRVAGLKKLSPQSLTIIFSLSTPNFFE